MQGDENIGLSQTPAVLKAWQLSLSLLLWSPLAFKAFPSTQLKAERVRPKLAA